MIFNPGRFRNDSQYTELSCHVPISTFYSTTWSQSTNVTDRQTDRQTNRRNARSISATCTACIAKTYFSRWNLSEWTISGRHCLSVHRWIWSSEQTDSSAPYMHTNSNRQTIYMYELIQSYTNKRNGPDCGVTVRLWSTFDLSNVFYIVFLLFFSVLWAAVSADNAALLPCRFFASC